MYSRPIVLRDELADALDDLLGAEDLDDEQAAKGWHRGEAGNRCVPRVLGIEQRLPRIDILGYHLGKLRAALDALGREYTPASTGPSLCHQGTEAAWIRQRYRRPPASSCHSTSLTSPALRMIDVQSMKEKVILCSPKSAREQLA